MTYPNICQLPELVLTCQLFFDPRTFEVLIHHPGFIISISIDLKYFLVFVLILGRSLRFFRSLCLKQGRPAPVSVFICLPRNKHLLTLPARGTQKKGTCRKITRGQMEDKCQGRMETNAQTWRGIQSKENRSGEQR